jgi:hypothetical protein
MLRNDMLKRLSVMSFTLLPMAAAIAAGPYGATNAGSPSSSGGPLAIGGITGLVMDNNSSVALTLSPGPYQVVNPSTLGAFVVPSIYNNGVVGACAITPDRSTAFVTGLTNQVQVINLTSAPPRIVSSVQTTSSAEGLSLTPNGKYLLSATGGAVCGASGIDVISVANWADQGQFVPYGGGAQSVSACDNGVDVVSTTSFGSQGAGAPTGQSGGSGYGSGILNQLKISPNGALSNFGHVYLSFPVNNSVCAPGSRAAVALSENGVVASYALPLGATGQTGPASYLKGIRAQSAAFSPDGTVLYVRYDGGNFCAGVVNSESPKGECSDAIRPSKYRYDYPVTGGVIAFAFNPGNGQIGHELWQTGLDVDTNGYYGIKQIAVTLDGKQVLVPGLNGLNVLTATNGAPNVVTNNSLSYGTGICLVPTAATSSTAPPNPCLYHACQTSVAPPPPLIPPPCGYYQVNCKQQDPPT